MVPLRTAARAALALAALLVPASAALTQDGLIGKINLMKSDGAQAVKGEWRYAEVTTTGVGPKKENELEPRAHGKFDDSKWDVLEPESLGQARGPGPCSPSAR